MRNFKKILSVILSFAMLLSCVFVGSVYTAAESTVLTKIVNTYDDEGVVYETVACDKETASTRTVNGVADKYEFAVWYATVEKFSEQNAVRFVKAKGYDYSWPAVVKVYDNNTSGLTQFKPKANTTYSISLRYNCTVKPSAQVNLQLRQRDTTNPKYTYSYNEADVIIPAIISATNVTNGWQQATATFTTGDSPANLFLCLASATTSSATTEIWVDDVVVEELYNITINNYSIGENKTVGLVQGSLVSDIKLPSVSGFKFGGVYLDAEYTQMLSSDTCLDSIAGSSIYFKWDAITTAQQYCGFEDYSLKNCYPFNEAVAEIVSSPVYLGSKALKIQLPNKGISAFEVRAADAFTIDANTQYSISFAYKTDAPAEISVGMAKAVDVAGSAVAENTAVVSASDSWQRATLSLTATKGTDDSYALAVMAYAENGATIYFDDILVTNLAEKEMTTMPSISLNTYPTLDVFAKDIWDGISISSTFEGEGTEESPYLVKNGADLAGAILGGGNGKYYKLTNNIYLNDLDLIDWETGEPVGEYVINSWYDDGKNANLGFDGTLDGDGYTVYGMYYKNGTPDANSNWGLDGAGLIPRVNVGQTANIKKLGVDYAYVSCINGYGASAFVGTAGVTWNTTSDTYAIINIDQCYAGKNVLLTANTVGVFRGSDKYSNLNLSNSYSLAKLVPVGAAVAYGFFGGRYESLFSIQNCYNGYDEDEINGVISNDWAQWIEDSCSNIYATGYNYIHQYAGKVVYYAENRSFDNMKGLDVFTNSSKMPNLNTNGVFTATESYPVLTAFIGKQDVVVTDDKDIVAWNGVVSDSLSGEGTEESPYLINNGGDLAYAITSGGGNDKFYKITTDIYLNDLDDANWYTGYRYNQNLNKWYHNTPFAGTIDGDGHTIYGLYYRDDDVYNTAAWSYYGAGLVPRVNRGSTVTIKNLAMDYTYIANRNAASAFIGFIGSTGTEDTGEPYATVNVECCYAGATVMIVGHEAGVFRGGTRYGQTYITNCYSLATTEAIEKNGGTGYTYGLIGNMWDSACEISYCYNANGPISSEKSTFKRTNCYETEKSTYGDAKVIDVENMVGGDVLTNSAKMPNLAAAGVFVPAYNTTLKDYYIYLPAGTVFEEQYDVNCYDSFFVPLAYDTVVNKAGVVERGAYFSFNDYPDTTKIVIPTEVYEFVRFGTRLELASNDTYYGDRMNVIRGTLDDQPDNAVNYMFITDLHYPYGPYYLTQALQNQVKLMVKTANEDDSIDFICIGGDSINGNQSKSENLKLLNAIFTPLLDCQKPVIIIQGNHDDSAWQSSFDMSQMFSHKDWKENIIDKYVNRTLENGTEIKVVNNSNDDNAEYYYYDLENKNTRLVVLDTIDYDMEYDENGTVTGLEILDETKPVTSIERYKTGYTYWGYSKEQLKWLADEALGKLPEGYDVIFLSHMGIDQETGGADYLGAELRGIISAYQNKSSYVNEDFDIDIDYAEISGKILSLEFGHTHYERLYYDADIDLIQVNTGLSNGYTITDGTRTFQSETEAQFDVMSVNRDFVYKMSVGNAGRTLKIYNPKKTAGDVNLDEAVDICDLVYLESVTKSNEIKTTTVDVGRIGTFENAPATLRSILIGTYIDINKPGISVDKSAYTPTTVTLTLYDEDSYGITWQTAKAPYTPVVQVTEGEAFDPANYLEYEASFSKAESYDKTGSSYNYYVSKAVITGLEAGKVYTYRCYDKYKDAASKSYTFTARNDTNESSFKFVHVGDSQTNAADSSSPDGTGTGIHYANTMKGVELNGFDRDFIVHSGDIVEWSKYESYWTSMIGDNDKYFAEIPVMTVSGNHETSYRNGANEVYKHFNYSIHSQNVSAGFSYSFDYGNTKFIMLDTNGLTNNQLPDDEYTWLSETLEKNTQKWTIVVMHNPMYSVGVYGSNPNRNAIALALREQLGDLFAENGVDLVIQGHDHEYSKTYPIGVDGAINNQPTYETINGINYCTNANGVIYSMHGPAGNQTRTPYSTIETEFYETYSGSHTSSWAEVEVTDELLTVKVYYYNSGSPTLWTAYGIKK